MMSHEEQRAHKRIEVHFSGTVSFKVEGREWQEAVEAKDFSAGGVYLVGDACPGVDEPIGVRLHLGSYGRKLCMRV